MSSPFNITTATNTIRLDCTHQAQTTFTVFNNSGRPIRGRAHIVTQDPAPGTWLALVGELEREFATASAHLYNMQVAVPPGAPAGSYPFRLAVTGTQDPGDSTVRPTDRLPGKFGFLQAAAREEVSFKIAVQTSSIDFRTVFYPRAYENGSETFDIPLYIDFRGRYISYICLLVDAGSDATQDRAIWADVRLTR